MEWPRDFQVELARRFEIERRIATSPVMLAGAKQLYAESPTAFIADCVWVYEPRNAAKGDPIRIPVVLFQRQREFIEWMKMRFETRTSAPVEKSRDSGATWMAAAFAVWLWLFHDGSVTGFGSRKEDLVDRAGDMNTIFEKIRSIIRHLPSYLIPKGFAEKAHFNHMRIVNPENGAVIVGEAGDNIGRGGRSSIYFIDEAAYIERPQKVEASLTANTDCRIDISTPQIGSLFCEWTARSTTKFIFDLFDVPWHTQAWVQQKKDELELKGLGHLFRLEYLRDATAGIEGQLIPADWVQAAVGAAEKLGVGVSGEKVCGLDVADGGADRNAIAIRHGVHLQFAKSRPDLLADAAGAWAYAEAASRGCNSLRYDSIGVGAGAAATLRGKKDIKVIGWSAAGEVISPTARYEGNRTNADMFSNAKAQAWWALRDRFLKTYRAVVENKPFDRDDIISLSGDIAEIRELKGEFSQVTYKHNNAGKIVINKAPDGHRSPNLADAVMIAFAPVSSGIKIIGSF